MPVPPTPWGVAKKLTRNQGLEDTVFPRQIAETHIKYFTSSVDARLTLVEGGGHYLNVTSPNETEHAILDMVRRHGQLAREVRL